jgi:hypothetical protein
MEVNMKNLFVKIPAVLLMVMVFASCVSIHYWDKNLPPEESVLLNIDWEIMVTSYNGVPVDWGRNISVYLPPGEIVLTMKFYILGSGTIYSGESTFTRDFKAGDKFSLLGWAQDGKPGILLFDKPIILSGEKVTGKSEFFPFPFSEQETGKIVLE